MFGQGEAHGIKMINCKVCQEDGRNFLLAETTQGTRHQGGRAMVHRGRQHPSDLAASAPAGDRKMLELAADLSSSWARRTRPAAPTAWITSARPDQRGVRHHEIANRRRRGGAHSAVLVRHYSLLTPHHCSVSPNNATMPRKHERLHSRRVRSSRWSRTTPRLMCST